MSDPGWPYGGSKKSVDGTTATADHLSAKGPSKKVKLMMLGGLAALLLVFGGVGAYKQLFLSKRPENIWKSGLSATYKGLEKLSEIERTGSEGVALDGSFKLEHPVVADATVSGQSYGSTGSLEVALGIAGAQFDAEIRTIPTLNSPNPDVYFKLDGLKSIDTILELTGGTNPFSAVTDKLEDKWFVVDHTLLSQFSVPEREETNAGASGTEALNKELKNRLFSTDDDKAVFELAEHVGREEFEGTNTYKFKVGVNKNNLKSFITAMQESLKNTDVEQTLMSSGYSLDTLLDTSKLFASIDAADFSNTTADVWVEENGRYIRNVRFYPKAGHEETNYLDIGVPYDGGDTVPMVVRIIADGAEASGTIEIGLEINHTNADTHFWTNVDVVNGGGGLKMVGDLTFVGNNDPVSVEQPEDATGIYELLGMLLGRNQLLPTDKDLEGLSAEEREQLEKYINDPTLLESIEL